MRQSETRVISREYNGVAGSEPPAHARPADTT